MAKPDAIKAAYIAGFVRGLKEAADLVAHRAGMHRQYAGMVGATPMNGPCAEELRITERQVRELNDDGIFGVLAERCFDEERGT